MNNSSNQLLARGTSNIENVVPAEKEKKHRPAEEWSQVPCRPTFDSLTMNSVAVVPLLCQGNDHSAGSTTFRYSERSFHRLMAAFARAGQEPDDDEYSLVHASAQKKTEPKGISSSNNSNNRWKEDTSEVTLVIPNSQLTRPGDWRYDSTPLHNFHWGNGCQRLRCFDGRPTHSRRGFDRIANPTITAPWSDLIPSRGTMAIIGVLSLKDCPDDTALQNAERELNEWAIRYSLGGSRGEHSESHSSSSSTSTDGEGNSTAIIQRIFVFDSFDETCHKRIDLTQLQATLGSDLVAFPPSDFEHSHMLDLHLRIVMNDLTVTFFKQLESRIKTSDALAKAAGKGALDPRGAAAINSSRGVAAVTALASLVTTTGNTPNNNTNADGTDDSDAGSVSTEVTSSANTVVSTASPNTTTTTPTPGSSNTNAGPLRGAFRAAFDAAANSRARIFNSPGAFGPSTQALLTPLDDVIELSSITPKEFEHLKKREVGRREKLCADLALMAGSPLDAYIRYNRAAELTKAAQDPLWYAFSLEGCASSFIAMADCGGHGVDAYLENNFRLPDEIISTLITNNAVSVGTEKKAVIDKTKTTLPEAITFLAEEALGIYSRHVKLAPMYAELLLKLAAYTAESEDAHRWCRWGEGEYSYRGEVGSPKRWESSENLAKSLADVGAAGKEQLAMDSWNRCRKFCELLHRAVSAGGLDARTRSDVAIACVRLCLKGIQPSRLTVGLHSAPRICLPRKAAFFSVAAAEAMSNCQSDDAPQRAASLWLAASHLLSGVGNQYDVKNSYSWVALRIAALHSVSQQVDSIAAEQAMELLLVLISEISPDKARDSLISRPTMEDDNTPLTSERNQISAEIGSDSRHSEMTDQSGSGEASSDVIEDSVALQKGNKPPIPSIARRSVFFGASRLATAMGSQSKWMDEDPIPQVQIPLVELSDLIKRGIIRAEDVKKLSKVGYNYNALSLLAFRCVKTKVPFELCSLAQTEFIGSLLDLRRTLPTISHTIEGSQTPSSDRISVTSSSTLLNSHMPPPLQIRSASVVKSESHLLLERVKAAGLTGKPGGMSMATFFNPYASKKSSGSVQTTTVAEGEERTVAVHFDNQLSVALHVPSCQLVFDPYGAERIEAAPLSFTIPPKGKNFSVHFPFIVLPAAMNKAAEKKKDIDVFQLLGLRVTCFSRCYFVSFDETARESFLFANSTSLQRNIPDPASTYPLLKPKRTSNNDTATSVRIESVPAQPNLLVSFTSSEAPLEDNAMVPVHLSDGEIFTIPPFRLQADFGASGQGKIERLQLIAAGLPGLPEEVLFDTEGLSASNDIPMDNSDLEDDDDFAEFMECDGLPPLRMKVLTEDLNLQSINDKNKAQEGTVVTFQIAAAHDMGNQLANGGNVRIRFRYRGPSPNEATEIWRRREVSLRIVRVKGPRISSLSFRPDLSWGSVFSELSHALAQQRLRFEALPKLESEKHAQRLAASQGGKNSSPTRPLLERFTSGTSSVISEDEEADLTILERIGTDASTNVSGDEAVVLMAVANETNATIILSNRKGRVGGFEGSPMPTIRVTSGVSVKIPVVIQRIDRLDDKGAVTDIVAELISRTALQWESVIGEGETNKRVRQGRVRIPSRCLREIIEEHGSFASRICQAPININVDIGKTTNDDATHLIKPGDFVHATVDLTVKDWVPSDAISRCTLTLEFCCARKDWGGSRGVAENDTTPPFIWCGQLRRTFPGENCKSQSMIHRAKLTFLQTGIFAVSACVKISAFGTKSEEVWWAPRARTVEVETVNQ